MGKYSKDNFLEKQAHFLMILIGIGFFSISLTFHKPDTEFFRDILNHLGGAITGGGIVYFILKKFSLTGKKDPLRRAIVESKNLKKKVAEIIFESSSKASDELLSTEELKGEPEYMKLVTKELEHIIDKKMGTLRAVCGNKNWDADHVQKYINKNIVAAEIIINNVFVITVTRLFYQDADYVKESTEKAMTYQAKHNIKIKFIDAGKLLRFGRREFLNNGFGFVIINDEKVVVHNRLEHTSLKNDPAFCFKNPMIVNEFIELFNELYELQPEYFKVNKNS